MKLSIGKITAICFMSVVAVFALIPSIETGAAAIGCPLIEPQLSCTFLGKDWSQGRAVVLDTAWWLQSAMSVLFPFTAFGLVAGLILMLCKIVPKVRSLGHIAIYFFAALAIFPGTMISFFALVINLIEWDYRYRYETFENSIQSVEGVKAQDISYYEGKLYAVEIWINKSGYVDLGVDGLASITKPARRIFQFGDKKFHCDGPGISPQTLSLNFYPDVELTAPEIVRRYEALDSYFETQLSNTEQSLFRLGQPEMISVYSDCAGCRTLPKKETDICWVEIVPIPQTPKKFSIF